MKTSLLVTALAVLAWTGLNLGGVAAAGTVADPPPMLMGLDQAKVVACAVAAGIGLVLVAWSLLSSRSERPQPVRVRIDDDER